ncbi:MAG TPA: PP2C family protein-serine/threonine phosphatase [Cyclobacteriaceae bacterium]|nr:PP2C family protein-serine/threonine phosphatase [Cyclobacteriaceae bacterium]
MFNFNKLNIGKITALVAILAWLSLLFTDLTRLFGELNQIHTAIAPELSWALEIVFFILIYIFYNNAINKTGNYNFIGLIWKAASTALVAAGVSGLIIFFYFLLQDSKLSKDPLLLNFFYHVNFGLTTIFLISSTMVWKHLILYQKNKIVVQQWQAFEVVLLMSMFFMFFNQNTLDYSFIFGLVFLVIFGSILSANLKWIPYLSFKDKWKALLFMVIILTSAAYLFVQLISYSSSNFHLVNLTDNLFLLGLFGFVFLYALFSFLVTLFNLPTSSVFEQKLKEAINFQRLSRSIQPGQNESQVLDILMDSCMSAAYVDAAWMEIQRKSLPTEVVHQRFISNQDRKEIREMMDSSKPFSEYFKEGVRWKKDFVMGRLGHDLYTSAIVFPLKVNKDLFANIFLLKEVNDGFNKEMVDIIATFVGQATISVENHRLLNEAIKNERYKEELEIAQRVQRSLLPSRLHHNNNFSISGFSEAADEVGGDYYETFQFNENKFALIIGDVSGKGTSAAFNMSQMKGVFHSLVQLDLSPAEFLSKANSALSHCLERNHFITTTYYLIDTSVNSIIYSRAGHCPTLYYSSEKGESEYMEVKGMGLGIIRSANFKNYIAEKFLEYKTGDVMLLYTDGIVEAKNADGEEFGYDNLRLALNEHHGLGVHEIKEKLIQMVYEFVGSSTLPDDDYSMVVVKFLR